MEERAQPFSWTHLAAAIAAGTLAALSGESRRARAGGRLLSAMLLAYAFEPLAAHFVDDAAERRASRSTRRSVQVDRPIGEVFAFFKNFENLPLVIQSLRSVIDYEDGRSRWTALLPSGDEVAWDVVVTKYLPRAVIAWESVPASPVAMRAVIRFAAPTPHRTVLNVEIAYLPPRHGVRESIATMLTDRDERLRVDLDHVRTYLESHLPAAGA